MFAAAETGRRVDAEAFVAQVPELRVELLNAQFDLRRADFPVVLLVDGDDRLACNLILQGIGDWLDARHVVMHVLGDRTEAELLRPPDWRYWSRLPRAGQTAVFVHSWVQDAIRQAATGEIDEQGLEHGIRRIRAFERTLVDEGTLLLKFWYHLPRKELGKRLQSGIAADQPSWRLGEEVERLYEKYEEAIALAERVVAATSTGPAPWHVIESTDPLYAGLETAQRVLSGFAGRLADVELPPIDADRAPTPVARPSDLEPDPRNGDEDHRPRRVLDAVDLEKRVNKEKYTEKLARSQAKLDALFTEADDLGISTVLVFEGWDAAGKGGAIRRLCRRIDPRLYRVIPVGAPTPEEQAHHYLWRFWRHLPRAGHLTIFDRSWYGRVLVERVEGLASEADWHRAYEEIRDFEAQLAEANTLVLKFWLHLSPQEQLRRFEAREKTPYKKYKITDEDYRNRARWEDYEVAVDEMVARTSTRACPWHLVPAEQKRVARLEVVETVRKKLGKAVKKARKKANGATAAANAQLG